MTETGRRHPGADHNVMRGVNRSLVVDLLKAQSPLSRAAVAKSTGLAKPTVSAIIEGLIDEGMVREIGFGATTVEGGRPPMLVEFNTRSQFVVGVHIGVRRTTAIVGDATGVEISRLQIDTPRGKPTEALQRIARLIRESLQQANAPQQRLSAVGVGVPGLVDVRDGVCCFAPNLGWRNVAVRAALEKALKVPIFVHNTAQACAVAESTEGGRDASQGLIFLYVGSGIGAGVLSDGRLFHGSAGSAGELGHCSMPGATAECSCGKNGCLETVAAARAIAARATEEVANGRESLLTLGGGTISSEAVVAAAFDGDELANEVLAGAANALGWAAAWLINLFSPQLVVIGGGIAEAGEHLADPLRRAALENVLPQLRDSTRIELSNLGQEAEVRGAVLLALQASESYYRVVFQG